MKLYDLKTLPLSPGIYLFKDKDGHVVYIGKAKSIRNRVKTYFQRNHTDWKVDSLIEEYSSIDYIVTKTEAEALLLEAQLISEHKPKYNVLLKDGQPFLYIVVTKDPIPRLELVRNKATKGTYFGPFLQKIPVRSAYRYLITTFRLKWCTLKIDNGCLDFHLGFCAGNCTNAFDVNDYLFRLDLAIAALEKDHTKFLKKLKAKIGEYNLEMAFEKSKNLNEYLENFDAIFATLKTRFSPKKFEDAIAAKLGPKLYVAPTGVDINTQLQEFLALEKPVSTIDCFDISHFQSSSLVGSCVRFVDGKPDKKSFRHFIIRSLDEQNDYAALQEIVQRRYKDPSALPDLIVIDGGKGQLSAVQKIVPEHIPCISLAKKEEIIFSKNYPYGIHLAISTEVGRLLIALRDYTHHFAITFHRKRRSKNFTGS